MAMKMKKSTRKKVNRAGKRAKAMVSKATGTLARKKKRRKSGKLVAAAVAVGTAVGLAAVRARRRKKLRRAAEKTD